LREFMIGLIAVGLVAGIILGRNTERARRSYKDLGAGRTAFQKYRKTALAEGRKAAITVLVVGVLLIALFVGALSTVSGR
jgi:ABC-type Fe3+ transport system permease subunit